MNETINEVKNLEKVNQSQLGVFINGVTGGNPLKITSLTDLANEISSEYSVNCQVEDLTRFYNLDDEIFENNIDLSLKNFKDEI